MPKNCYELSVAADDDSLVHSGEDSSSTEASVVTVLGSQRMTVLSCDKLNDIAMGQAQSQSQVPTSTPTSVEQTVIELPDTQPIATQQLLISCLKPPLLLRESFTIGPYFYLIVYEYNEQLANPCRGSCTLRFALDDKRLGDRSTQTLEQLQLLETDIWYRDSDRGIYDKIDQYTNK